MNETGQARPLRRPDGLALLALLAVAFGVLFRVLWVDTVPGMNGDEAWFGVRAFQMIEGTGLTPRTPTGNLVNPFFIGPITLLHALGLPPSFALIRAINAAAGVATVLLAYPLFRGSLGRRGALILTVLIAASPPLIAYSRMGWDPGEMPLASLLVMAAALAGRRVLTLLALVGAIVVHPASIFLLPVALVALVAANLARGRGLGRELVLAALAGLAVYLLLHFTATQTGATDIGAAFRAHVLDGAALASFGSRLALLFSPVSVAQHMAGPVPQGWIVAFAVLWAGVLTGTAVGLVRRPGTARRGLALGLALSLAAFVLLAGPAGVLAQTARYGIPLVIPVLIGLAVVLGSWARQRAVPLAVLAVLAVLALVNLGGMWALFLHPLRSHGGAPELTFRTAPVEPKIAIYADILRHAETREALILAEDWWVYWAVKYQTYGHAAPDRPLVTSIRPLFNTPLADYAVRADQAQGRRVFLVLFAGGAVEAGLAAETRERPLATASDPLGRPILNLYEVSADWLDRHEVAGLIR